MTTQTATAKNNHSVNVEKRIARPQAEVFRAISEGRLFFNCGANQSSARIDFRVGGRYQIEWKMYGFQNQGEFTEISPHSRIAFTWTQDPTVNQTPDTQVTIDLVAEGAAATVIRLKHTGFKDQESADDHEGGWAGGLTDLGNEMAQGKLLLIRTFPVSVAKLYEACKNPAAFLGLMGDSSGTPQVDFRVGGRYDVPHAKGGVRGAFTEIVPNQKIVFTWENAPCGEPLTRDTKVTLLFEADDEDANKSWLTLTHEGLEKESQQKAHREGWDSVLDKLTR